MPNPIIELACHAEWISYVAQTRIEAETYTLSAHRWGAAAAQFPCPFDKYIPASAFSVGFGADQRKQGDWYVSVECAWSLSRHPSVEAAVKAAEHFYDNSGLSLPKMETLVFGRPSLPTEKGARAPTLLKFGLMILKATSEGTVSYTLGGVKDALTVKEEWVAAIASDERRDR